MITATQDDVRPRLTDANLLLNEAIREYLEFAGYRHTLSVFLAEAGQPAEPLRRDFVAHKLHLPPVVPAETPPGASSLEMCVRALRTALSELLIAPDRRSHLCLCAGPVHCAGRFSMRCWLQTMSR